MTIDVPTVTLVGEAMVPLVQAAAALQAEGVPPCAVIGGVAVAVRIGRLVRSTADLDTVTDYRYSPSALEVLRARDDTDYDPTNPHTITLGGTEVQFQEVVAVTDADVEHLDPKHLLYVAGHAHALAAATAVRVVAIGPASHAEAVVPIATSGALVAMKLHAFLDRRRGPGPDKRPGDLWDIYNLLLLRSTDAAADLSTGGVRLRQVVAEMTSRHLVTGAARARAVLRSSNDDRYQAITADELTHAALTFLELLRRA